MLPNATIERARAKVARAPHCERWRVACADYFFVRTATARLVPRACRPWGFIAFVKSTKSDIVRSGHNKGMEGGALYSRSPHAKSMAHRSGLRRTVVLCPRETWEEKTMHTGAGCITVSIDDSRRAIGHELLAWGRAALAPAIPRSNVTASLRSRTTPLGLGRKASLPPSSRGDAQLAAC